MPVWGIFELISLGQFGLFVSFLNESVSKKASRELGFHQGCDSNGRLTEDVVFAIRELRNSVAHNDVIFDTRFKRSKIPERLKSCLELETGIKDINFGTIVDYLILLIYVSRNLQMTTTECKGHIREFTQIIERVRGRLLFSVFFQIVHTDTASKIKSLQFFVSGKNGWHNRMLFAIL